MFPHGAQPTKLAMYKLSFNSVLRIFNARDDKKMQIRGHLLVVGQYTATRMTALTGKIELGRK